jgi:hypothetical protein
MNAVPTSNTCNRAKSRAEGRSQTQILLIWGSRQAPKSKIFLFTRNQITGTLCVSRPAQRGVGRRHDEGRGCGGRGMRKARRMTRTAKACGPDTPLLVSSSRKAKSRSGATVARKPVHRGERVISRKAIAQGMSDVLRCPVCSCAHFSVHDAHETAGAARIRHSLRPLNFGGRNDLQNFGQIMPRECETAFGEDSNHTSSRA